MNTLQVKKNLSKETKHKEQFRVEKYSKNKKMEGKIVNWDKATEMTWAEQQK